MPRRPPFSVLLAIGLALLLLLWLAFGDIEGFRETSPEAEATPPTSPVSVEVVERHDESHSPRLVLQGQLEAHRELELRARQAGQVVALPVPPGSRVDEGDVLLELGRDELPERLDLAESELALARSELAAADELLRRDLISRIDYQRLQSGVRRALAEVATLQRQLEVTRPEAAFSGVLDRLDVELGERLQAGEHWGRLIDDSQLVASAWAPQRDVSTLKPGQPAEIQLLDGSRLAGELIHVASRADEATRSFHVEARLDNPERRRLAGVSATLTITLPARRVHHFSPALLELDAEGHLAVKHLDEEDRVVLDRVELVEADVDGVRVAGLPSELRLITAGAGFVEPGQRVRVVSVGSAPTEAGDRDTLPAIPGRP